MIPKVIHYCWFGRNPLPPLAIKCIDSWKKYLPDYEIKEWNEDNFDVNIIPYTAQAYQAKKYAFVSDYARFWILYKYGGIYFDTDVEVIKPINDILANGAFMGCETDGGSNTHPIRVAPGLGLAVEANNPLYKYFLEHYSKLEFIDKNGKLNMYTVVQHTTDILFKFGLINNPGIQNICGITIYPSEYFNPRNSITKKMHITKESRTIHYGNASWKNISQLDKLKNKLRFMIPEFILIQYSTFKKKKKSKKK